MCPALWPFITHYTQTNGPDSPEAQMEWNLVYNCLLWPTFRETAGSEWARFYCFVFIVESLAFVNFRQILVGFFFFLHINREFLLALLTWLHCIWRWGRAGSFLVFFKPDCSFDVSLLCCNGYSGVSCQRASGQACPLNPSPPHGPLLSTW